MGDEPVYFANVARVVGRWALDLDQILRHPVASDVSSTGLGLSKVFLTVLICGSFYGACMGSYAWAVGGRDLVSQLPMMFYAAVKVPLLLATTMAIALPSYFVVNTLLGLRNDFQLSMQAVITAQAGLAIVLASLSGMILFVYCSLPNQSSAYRIAVLTNAGFFAIASFSAQRLLKKYYRPLIISNKRHRVMMKAWIFVYAFVGIQCGWILRPFIGHPQIDPTFFRADKLGNAYVIVLEMVWNLIRECSACRIEMLGL